MSSEETQLSKASDTVHEESNYSDEYNRTHGQPESQRDPTLFENTDQDNLVDISTNGTNSEITNTITEELTKLSTTQDITDNHSPTKSEEHTDKSKKTPNHSPTRRKSLTNQVHHDTKNQSNTQEKTVHHSPTRRKSITSDHSINTKGKTTTDTHTNIHGKNTNHSPTRRKSITHDTTNNHNTDTHKKSIHHSPTRRKSITHDGNKDVSDHSNAHNTRRKSNTHEHDKDQPSNKQTS